MRKSIAQRVRSDAAYIFATLFAGIGGFALVGSYADQKPVETFRTGSYALSAHATDQTNTYTLGLNKSYHYCFNAVALVGDKVLIEGSKPETLALTNNITTSCFQPTTSYNSVKVMLPPSLQTATRIIVSS